MSSWKDEAAVNVITRTMRVQLIKTLDIEKGSTMMKNMAKQFNANDIDYICCSPSAFARARRFIDVLSDRMTTELFSIFVHTLDDWVLQEEILQAYTLQGGDIKKLTPEFQ